MSNPLAIAAVTATFGRLVRNVPLSGITFSAMAPDIARASGDTTRQLNIYLYSVTPNAAYRNADLPTRAAGGELVGQPVVALDLHYLLTAYGDGDDEIDAHHLLAHAMSLINDRPVLTRASILAAIAAESATPATHPELAASDLAEQPEAVKLTMHPLSSEDMFNLWSAFQTGYRLSVAYEASLVLIERRAAMRSRPRPRAAQLTVLPLSRPRAERVEPPETTAETAVAIIGSELGTGAVRVRVDGELTPPDAVTAERVTVTLPGGLQAGIHALSVVRDAHVETGDVPLFESNVVALVLIPRISGPIASVAALGTLVVDVAPPVGRHQDALVLVGDVGIPVPPRTADAPLSSLAVTLPPAVTAGDHLVRVRVDGAESELQTTGGVFSGPTVTVT
jgi:hypothetical protein